MVLHTVFARAERADKDELFDTGPLVGRAFEVGKLSVGYAYSIPVAAHFRDRRGRVGQRLRPPLRARTGLRFQPALDHAVHAGEAALIRSRRAR